MIFCLLSFRSMRAHTSLKSVHTNMLEKKINQPTMGLCPRVIIFHASMNMLAFCTLIREFFMHGNSSIFRGACAYFNFNRCYCCFMVKSKKIIYSKKKRIARKFNMILKRRYFIIMSWLKFNRFLIWWKNFWRNRWNWFKI